MNKRQVQSIRQAVQMSYSVEKEVAFSDFFKTVSSDLMLWQSPSDKGEGLIDVIDFFSGCGGMSLGFSALSQKNKIYDIKGGIDINEMALSSYRNNFKTNTICRDIREMGSGKEVGIIKKTFGVNARKKPLVIIGCAPCQGFTAHRKKNWDKTDERNTLVGFFADIAIKFNPDYIVMENVPEILGEKYWAHYEEAREVLARQGYKLKQTIYNSASFGVPQARFRAIIVAYKTEFDLPLPIYDDKEFKTVRDAIGDLPPIRSGEINPSDRYHRCANHKRNTLDTISKVPRNGGSRPFGVGPACSDKVNGFSDVYGRLYWDRPSITLTQYSRNPASGRFTHPEQNRGLTIREAARLQSFPDTYCFEGSLDDCFKQIGESVPPLLSLAIAAQILLNISGLAKTADKEIVSITSPVNGYPQPILNKQSDSRL